MLRQESNMGHMSPLLQSYGPAPFCHCSFPQGNNNDNKHGNNNDNKHFNSRIASPPYQWHFLAIMLPPPSKTFLEI